MGSKEDLAWRDNGWGGGGKGIWDENAQGEETSRDGVFAPIKLLY